MYCVKVKVQFTLEAMNVQRGSRGIGFTLSLTSTLDWGGWLVPCPGKRPRTHCKGGWVGPSACLDKCRKSRFLQDLIPGPFSPQRVVILSTLSRPTDVLCVFICKYRVLNETYVIHWKSITECSTEWAMCWSQNSFMKSSKCAKYNYEKWLLFVLQYVVIPIRRSTAEAFQILISHAFGDAGSPYLVGVVSSVPSRCCCITDTS
jgi:hypothetical protein